MTAAWALSEVEEGSKRQGEEPKARLKSPFGVGGMDFRFVPVCLSSEKTSSLSKLISVTRPARNDYTIFVSGDISMPSNIWHGWRYLDLRSRRNSNPARPSRTTTLTRPLTNQAVTKLFNNNSNKPPLPTHVNTQSFLSTKTCTLRRRPLVL